MNLMVFVVTINSTAVNYTKFIDSSLMNENSSTFLHGNSADFDGMIKKL